MSQLFLNVAVLTWCVSLVHASETIEKPDFENEDEWRAQEQKKNGPVLIFVEVVPKQPTGAPWTSSALQTLNDSWKRTLHAAGVPVTVVRVSGQRMMVSPLTSQHAPRLKDLLLQQPSVAFVEWNHKRYIPEKPKPWRPTAPGASQAAHVTSDTESQIEL